MANSFFKFKQFSINQDKCAMKVGTDGVLLGAWSKVGESLRILDIGTGTGLIALMMAQRYNAQITGIEIDPLAAQQALENIQNSPFVSQIEICQTDFDIYCQEQTSQTFSAIISNPPYFHSSLASPNKERTIARHADNFSFNQLFKHSQRLLTNTGAISVIIPAENFESLNQIALENQLHLHRKTSVSGRADLPIKRMLLEWRKYPSKEIESNHLNIEIERGIYTSEFIKLVQDFYLKL